MVAKETVNKKIKNLSKDRGRVRILCLSVSGLGHTVFWTWAIHADCTGRGFLLWLLLAGSSHSLAPKGCLLYLFSKDSFLQVFSKYTEHAWGLALDASICDHCCFSSEIEKTNKQCSEFLLALWFRICVHHGVLRQLRATFLRRTGLKKLFLSPLHICYFVDTPWTLTFHSKAPFSLCLWCQGWQGFVLQAACFHQVKSERNRLFPGYINWYKQHRIQFKKFCHHLG